MGTRWRACSFEPYRLGDADDEGEHRLLVDRYLGTLDVGLARDVEQLLATQPSELHALTAELSAGETEQLLQRPLDGQGERERAKGPQELHAEVRVVWQREQELLEELTALLDDAQRALCEALPPLPGAGRRARRWSGPATDHGGAAAAMMLTGDGRELDAQAVAWSGGVRPRRSPAIGRWSVVSGRSPAGGANLRAIRSRASRSASPPRRQTSTKSGRRERHVAWRGYARLLHRAWGRVAGVG